jgi:surface antigen
MLVLRSRAATAIAAVLVSVGLAVPAAASAGPLLPAAASQYNTTPDCPVSPTDIVCGWNVPVDIGNLFSALDYGQCPYWAAEKYPLLVLDEVLSDPLGDDWNGNTWIEHAQEEGLTVTDTPASGDLAVWQATTGNSSGHVAYVEALDASAIIVSQMDGDSAAPFPVLQGSTEYINATNLAYYEQSYGLEFISTGDPSTTPLSDVEQPSANPTTATPTTATTSRPAPSATRTSAQRAAAKRAAAKRAAAKQRAAAARKRAAAAKRRAAAERAARARLTTHRAKARAGRHSAG